MSGLVAADDVLDAYRLRVNVPQGSGCLAELGNPAMAVRVQGRIIGAARSAQGHIEAA
jgi:hypothetical protein